MDKRTQARLEEAVALIGEEGTSCVVIKGGEIIHTADGRGVAPLIALYDNQPDKLRASLVVDRIIGKAAAVILTLGGAQSVYGTTMSAAGRDYLQKMGVEASFGRCVDVIVNRLGTGVCPIEGSVLEIDDPAEGLIAIRARIAELMRAV